MTEVAAAIAALIFLGGNLPGRCFFFNLRTPKWIQKENQVFWLRFRI